MSAARFVSRFSAPLRAAAARPLVALRPLVLLLFVAALTPLAPRAADDQPTSPTLGKWQQLFVDRVALFAEENAKLEPGSRPIVFAGDSLTQGMPTATLFPDRVVLNRGIVSDGTADFPNAEPPHYRGLSNRLAESIFDPHPGVLFILIGTNDIGQNVPLDYWQGELTAILDRVAAEMPDCRVVMQTLPPTGPPYKRVDTLNPRIVEYNERLKALAAERHLPIIDLYALYANEEGLLPSEITNDGLHIKKEAYDRWAEAARAFFPPDPLDAAGLRLVGEVAALGGGRATRLRPETIWTMLGPGTNDPTLRAAFDHAMEAGDAASKLALIRALELHFILDPATSSLDLLGPELSEHFRDFEWDPQDFPGGTEGPNEKLADILVDALDLVSPERRANRTRESVIVRGEATPEVWEYMESQWRPVPGQEEWMLNRHALESFVRMREQAKKEGVELVILSGHRLRSTAEANAARAGNSNAVASFSAHSLGLAIDFQMSQGDLKFSEVTTRPMAEVVRMRESPVHKWLHLRAAEFDWYPYQNEPWHWEYNPLGFREVYFADFPGGAPPRGYMDE